jgi:hypothetical protein
MGSRHVRFAPKAHIASQSTTSKPIGTNCQISVSESQDEIGPVTLSACRTYGYEQCPQKIARLPKIPSELIRTLWNCSCLTKALTGNWPLCISFMLATAYKRNAGAAVAKMEVTTFDGASLIPE